MAVTFRPGARALVLAAHTDDEFGCAGTILRLLDAGAEVRYLALSRCEESVPVGYPADILEIECRRCLAGLGLGEERVTVGRHPVRHFPSRRQEILEELVEIGRAWAPELVLLPCSEDTHQDHATVAHEGFRAFKHASLLGYELPQNLLSFRNSAFVGLSERQLEVKLDALSCYRSQGFRPYSSPDFIRGLAHLRGVQSGLGLAEAFELVRLVV